MHVKKLEVFGFKSFPEKTSFLFEPGITAIVGPNGCGKTNVVDAVKWVLGEQSAHALRGSHMGDVVFNGTESRKALGMAEVSLTFHNEDNSLPIEYPEVMISRRIFRSGESQYFINKAPCRLKDISELFMDTGIGTTAYSLLEQGKVDLILSSKPEDRRFLFEEAAGIMKVKTRKREALRKLESTEQNLLRVSDIIVEKKRQIGSLQRQVGKAKRYQTLNDELKELEITLALDEFRHLEKSNKKYEGSLSGIREETRILNSDVEKSDSALERMRMSLAETEAEEVWKKIRDISEKIIQSENKVVLYRDRIEALNLRKGKSLEEIDILKSKHTSVLDELSNLELEKEELGKDGRDKKEKVETKEKRLTELAVELKKKEKELVSIKEKIVGFASLEAKNRSELASLKAVDDSLSARNERLSLEKLHMQEEERGSKKEFTEISTELEKKGNELSAKGEQLKQVEGRISDLKGNLENLHRTIYSKKEELNSSKSTLELMEEMRRNYEGYISGVRTIMSARDSVSGICGVVGDLLNVPGKLEVAIESALGEKVQYLLVGENKDAMNALHYLREKNGGRATFLPLDSVRDVVRERIGDDILSCPGIIGIASKEVSFDSKYTSAMNFLLNGIIIVENTECARVLVPKVAPGFRVVTLNGEVIDASGPISGGSVPVNGTGLIGRNEHIRALQKSIAGLKASAVNLEKQEIEISAELKNSITEAEELRGKLDEEKRSFTNLENVRSQLKSELERLSNNISLVNDEIVSVQKDRDRSRLEISELSAGLDGILNDKDACEQKMHSIQEYLENSAEEREEILTMLTEIKIALASIDEKGESLKTGITLRQKTCSEYEEEIRKHTGEIDGDMRQAEEFESAIADIEKELHEFAEIKLLSEGKRSEIDENRKRITSEIEKIGNSLKEKREQLTDKQGEMHRLDVQCAELTMQINSLAEKMSSRYRMDIKVLAEEKTAEEFDRQIVSEEAVRLRTKLEAMGPVNLVAIEEHKELEEEYNFLCKQRDDLLSAKESLHKVISKINQRARSMFMDTFRRINECFGEIFMKLFGGGRAELLLVDERNVLESGIEIIARPPGKKLQSISLLSGGEKAMTAISLLFAIMNVKPSPFCILDEIDAPLDDSNIGRFTQLIKESTKNSQFIIITHNKVTISVSDIIYGITMEERGVSRQVPVKFSERGNLVGEVS